MDQVYKLIIFILALFIMYRLFKTLLHGVIILIAGAAFPFIADYLNLGLPITPDFATAVQFAFLALALFSAYNFFHLIVTVLKFITAPFRRRKK